MTMLDKFRAWLISGRYFVFLIRGSTVGLFLGRPGPPVPVISGRHWGVGGSGPELDLYIFSDLDSGPDFRF